jgi:hypothetical protein
MNPKTAQKWVEAHEHCQKTRAPSVLAKYAEGKYKTAVRVLLDTPKKAKIRIPRGVKVKTAQAAKKDLRKELEALCKAIVFTRDCGSPEAREGNCISCGQWHVLQWGHFIRQQDSKWLQYDPRNTGGQCRGCNGPGKRGNVLEYAIAIDKRDGDGSAKALQIEAGLYRFWRPNKDTLGEMLRKLQEHPLAPKANEVSAAKPHPDPKILPHPPAVKDTP